MISQNLRTFLKVLLRLNKSYKKSYSFTFFI